MDQATATIIGAVIALSGSVTAAVIAAKWKSRSELPHHVHEYHMLYPTAVEQKPWIRGSSQLARIVRGVGWIVVAPLIFFGITALFWGVALIAGWSLFGNPELPQHNLVAMALLPSGVLALIAGHWISKRIEIPPEPDDSEED